MKKVFKVIAALTLLVVLAASYAGYRISRGHPFNINQLANRQAIFMSMDNPELFTQIGAVDGTPLDFHSSKLADVGVPRRDADYAFAERAIEDVRRFDRARLVRNDQITYDVLLDFFSAQLGSQPFDYLSSEGLYPISPMFGTQVQLIGFMQNVHVVKNDKTARNYVKRLQAMAHKLDALSVEMQRQATLGLVLPPALLERSITVIDDTIAAAAADSALVSSFRERMQSAGIDKALSDELLQQAVVTVDDSIYPAYRRMREALIAERPAAQNTAAGIGRLTDGVALYQAALKQFTTTDYTPGQVHNIGRDEVTRILAEMDVLLRAQGLNEGSVAARMAALNVDPRMQFPNDDAGREQLLAGYREILAAYAARTPEVFGNVPAEKIMVQRMPISSEKGAALAYYNPAAMDGSRGGTFFTNLRDVAETPRYKMKTLAAHEGIPGHHFQIAIAHTLNNLPLLRQQPIYTAYVEGWALYAERLVAEMGFYQDDPFSDLGRLQAELHRAVRLVVDSGLHAKGWTREQAIDYMLETAGLNEGEVVSEVERYMALPGQACAYKIGQLKILELREKSRAALGDRFDLKDFHGVVLGNGALPLTLLEGLVGEWIAAGGGQQ